MSRLVGPCDHQLIIYVCRGMYVIFKNLDVQLLQIIDMAFTGFSMDQKPVEDSRRSFFSSKCKVLTLATILVVVVEILFVQQWDKQINNIDGKPAFWQYHRSVEKKTSETISDEPTSIVESVSVETIGKPTVLTQTDEEKPALPEEANYAVRKYLSLQDKLHEKLKAATNKKVILSNSPIISIPAIAIRYGNEFA